MTPEERQRLTLARQAVDKLSNRYTKPRKLEAALNKLGSAIRDLPKRLTHIAEDIHTDDLCGVLAVYAETELLGREAVISCRELNDLAELADYEIGDQEDFGDQTEGKLEVLVTELKEFLNKLEGDAEH